MSASPSVVSRPNKRRAPSNEPYDHFDWYKAPLPDCVVGIFRRPVQKYDDDFNLADFMRNTSYGEPFRVPPYVVCIKKHHKPIPCPRGDVVTYEHCKGRRDYLKCHQYSIPPDAKKGGGRKKRKGKKVEWHAISSITVIGKRQSLFFGSLPPEDGFISWNGPDGTGHYHNRQFLRPFNNLRDCNNNMDAPFMHTNGTTRMRGGKGHTSITLPLDPPLFQIEIDPLSLLLRTSRLSHHSTPSQSASSNHAMETVGEPTMNVFSAPNQPTWVQNPQPNVIQSGYVNVEAYGTQSYHNVSSNNQMTNAVVVSDGPTIAKQPPSPHSDTMQDAQMAEINEFFVTNPYQPPENSNNLATDQMRSPPTYATDRVFKSEEVDFGFDTATMYEPVMQQPVYPQPQHEQPAVIRTAAGGDCPTVTKFDTSAEEFEQPQQMRSEYQIRAPAEFPNYPFQEMSVEELKNIYLPGSPNQYTPALPDLPDTDRAPPENSSSENTEVNNSKPSSFFNE